MQHSKNDLWVGLFVLLGAAALIFLALQSANLLNLNFRSGYVISARFDNIGGLKPKSAVRSAGVVVGRVRDITFDDATFQARVTLELENRYLFPKDSSLKILTSGLLGDQYIGIEPGADEHNLASGDLVRAHPLYTPALLLVLLGAFTQSAQFPFHFWLPHARAAPTSTRSSTWSRCPRSGNRSSRRRSSTCTPRRSSARSGS